MPAFVSRSMTSFAFCVAGGLGDVKTGSPIGALAGFGDEATCAMLASRIVFTPRLKRTIARSPARKVTDDTNMTVAISARLPITPTTARSTNKASRTKNAEIHIQASKLVVLGRNICRAYASQIPRETSNAIVVAACATIRFRCVGVNRSISKSIYLWLRSQQLTDRMPIRQTVPAVAPT